MKTTHALNFFLVGLAMCFCPALWPHHFVDGAGASATSELWLLAMGIAQMLMGVWAMSLNLVPQVTHFLAEWEPITINFELPDVSWALPESFYAGLGEDEAVAVALRLQQQLQLGRA